MKKIYLSALLVCGSLIASAQWKPATNNIITPWGENLDPQHVLPEYPRPIMERENWLNLNGLWDYTLSTKEENNIPATFDGKILVPFAIESSLSGVGKEIGPDKSLWYHRTFSVPTDWKGKKLLLNFGAVDWQADVYLNDIKIGRHTGGSTSFSFDITPYLKKSGEQKLVVRVWDPTSSAFIPKGKQRNDGKVEIGMWWYPPVTGIWQTVWLEPVNDQHITNLKMVPDIDTQTLHVNIESKNTTEADRITFKISDGKSLVCEQTVTAGQIEYEAVMLPFSTTDIISSQATFRQSIQINIPSPKLWSPDSPFLYDVEIELYHNGKKVDQIKSYCAMRKVSIGRDAQGLLRLQLNNKMIFHNGPLDQGWWPDGLYTAPSDEALVYDIKKTKELGFNMIRKHVKVEPARWYTHCDRIGILVWQDMPSCDYDKGEKSPEWVPWNYFNGRDVNLPAEDMATYCKEWKEIMDFLYSYPSIVMWVPFNEAWGQFCTKAIADWTKKYDPSRTVNAASGGNLYADAGEVLDTHYYPGPELRLFNPNKVNVIGEYGPCGFQIIGHDWYAPTGVHDPAKLRQEYIDQTNKYINAMNLLKTEIGKGASAAVYCQTTDVFRESNGLVTFDRKSRKFNEKEFTEANKEISDYFGE